MLSKQLLAIPRVYNLNLYLLCVYFKLIVSFVWLSRLVFSFSATMGRKGNYDVKEKRGPGRKTKKQGEPSMGLFIAKTTKKSAKEFNNSSSALKRFALFC